jgi:hypothetical protein
LDRLNAGNSIPARIATMAMTTNSSISVNARCVDCDRGLTIFLCTSFIGLLQIPAHCGFRLFGRDAGGIIHGE